MSLKSSKFIKNTFFKYCITKKKMCVKLYKIIMFNVIKISVFNNIYSVILMYILLINKSEIIFTYFFLFFEYSKKKKKTI